MSKVALMPVRNLIRRITISLWSGAVRILQLLASKRSAAQHSLVSRMERANVTTRKNFIKVVWTDSRTDEGVVPYMALRHKIKYRGNLGTEQFKSRKLPFYSLQGSPVLPFNEWWVVYLSATSWFMSVWPKKWITTDFTTFIFYSGWHQWTNWRRLISDLYHLSRIDNFGKNQTN